MQWEEVYLVVGGTGDEGVMFREMPLHLKKMLNPSQASRRPNPKIVSNTISMQPCQSANKRLCSDDFKCFWLDPQLTQKFNPVTNLSYGK